MSSINEIVVLVTLAAIVLFFVFREVTTWYFKINKIVKNQEEMIRLMSKMAEQKQPEPIA